MNSTLHRMLQENIFKKLPTTSDSKIYKSGTHIEAIEPNCDNLMIARHKYILNLCSIDPKPFEIPKDTCFLEKCCMMFSFNDYSLLQDDIFKHKILGAFDAKQGIQALYIHIDETECNDFYKYTARGLQFNNISIQPLTRREQSILCLFMIKTYNETKCESLRISKVQAYIDRLLFPKNETCFLISRVVQFYNSLINFDQTELNFVANKVFYLDPEDVFTIPIILRRDMELQLANLYAMQGHLDKARDIYSFYRVFDLEIDCLIRLGRGAEAIEKIQIQLKDLHSNLDFDKKVMYSNYCIKIAHLSDDVTYFDKAFDLYKSYEPLYYKGVHLFKRQKFCESVTTFRDALKLAPENESILFSYACCLKEVSKFKEAADVYEKLVEKDNGRLEYHKNLALCYLYLNDLTKSMDKLKSVVSLDSNCSELFFRLALAQNLKSEVLWAFTKLDYSKATKDKIDLVLRDNILNKKELRESLIKNPKLRPHINELIP